jgi:hypothetical protein
MNKNITFVKEKDMENLAYSSEVRSIQNYSILLVENCRRELMSNM